MIIEKFGYSLISQLGALYEEIYREGFLAYIIDFGHLHRRYGSPYVSKQYGRDHVDENRVSSMYRSVVLSSQTSSD